MDDGVMACRMLDMQGLPTFLNKASGNTTHYQSTSTKVPHSDWRDATVKRDEAAGKRALPFKR